jgi:hypothetical protein
VEASWTVPDTTEPLGKTILPLYDTDLGPSHPLPPEPANLGGADETTVISAPGLLPQVTALAVAKEGKRKGVPFIISGHKDGTIRKWYLNQPECVWAVRAYSIPDEVVQQPEDFPCLGIRGIAIRDDSTRGHGTYRILDSGVVTLCLQPLSRLLFSPIIFSYIHVALAPRR